MVPKILKATVVWELQAGQPIVLWDYLQAANLDTLNMGPIPRHWGEPKPGQVKCLYKAN